MRVLVADADAALAESLRQVLAAEDFSVEVVSSPEEAEQRAVVEPHDLLILDLHWPGRSGLDLLRDIKSKNPGLPILVSTRTSVVEERVRALDGGADDCVVKPCAHSELAARLRALLRRGDRSLRPMLTVADLALDRLTHTVERCGRPIDLSPREFALLEFLMRHAGHPVTRVAIVENVWKMNFQTETNVVDVYINYLRRKVDSGHEHALIRTIRGIGYQIGSNGAAG